MQRILLLLMATLCSYLVFAQETKKETPTKIDAFSSKTGVIVKITDYKLPALKASYSNPAETRVRVISGTTNKPAYFFQVEKEGKYGNSTASIEYADLLEVIKALATLKTEVEKDLAANPDYLENKFTTVDGFQLGYYISEGKVKWYLQLEKYGSDKTLFIDKVETIEAAFDAAKNKIEELRK
jgi:hypothetical protein